MSLKVIDALLSPDALQSMLDAVESESFPWETSEILLGGAPGLAPQDNVQSVHGLYAWRNRRIYRSPFLPVFAPVLDWFGPMRLIKAKLNRIPARQGHLE